MTSAQIAALAILAAEALRDALAIETSGEEVDEEEDRKAA